MSDLSDDELARERWLWQPRLSDRLRYLLFVDEASPNEIADVVIRLGVRRKDRIVFADFESRRQTRAMLARFLEGLASDDDDGRIIKASIEDGDLVVIAPTFEELRVPLALLRRVRDASLADWARFELDPHGEYLHWPKLGVHMGWSHLLRLVDPKARLRAEQRSEIFNQRYGAAIRALRGSAGLSQSSIYGLSDRTLRRIETGETRATSNALQRLAAAHGLEFNDYLARLAGIVED